MACKGQNYESLLRPTNQPVRVGGLYAIWTMPLGSRRHCLLSNGRRMSTEAWKPAAVQMLVQLAPFYEGAVWFYYSPNVARLTEKLACHPNS